MRAFLNSQPLLLPALTLALSIIAIDKGLSTFISWCLILIILVCFTIAKQHSNRTLFLSLSLTTLGLYIHNTKLNKTRQLDSLAHSEVTVLAVVEREARAVRDFRNEVEMLVIKSLDEGATPILTGERIIANIPNHTSLNIGEKIWLRGKLRPPPPAMNPFAFDKATFLKRKNITLELYALDAEHSSPPQIATSHIVQAWAQRSRQWIRHHLTKGVYDPDAQKIILAMFLGEKPRNGSEIMNAFKFSGTIHVFAVSGLHVMMIGLLFSLALRLLRAPPSVWVPLVILIMFFYAIITGMNPPAMRAAIMGSIVLLSLLLSRKPSLPNSLWLSAIIAMLWNTHCLFLPGFQLSYVVLISILITGNWWARRWQWVNYIDPFMPRSLLTRRQQITHMLRTKCASTLSVSSSAWFGSSFLIWLYFGLITPIAILASLPIMLLVFALLSICCLSLTLGSLSDAIATPLNQLNSWVANSTHTTTKFFSAAEFLRYQRKPWASGERVVIYSIPEGGAATYISIGGGVLLDGGNYNHFYSEIWPSLRKNSAKLDSLIASHPDINHIQGLTAILQQSQGFPINQLLIPQSNRRSKSLKELTSAATTQGITLCSPALTSLPLNTSSHIQILDTGDTQYPLADDRCPVFLLHWHDKTILFLNDAGGYTEYRLKQNHPNLHPDIIVLGKHSQEHSLSTSYLIQLDPKHVIASNAQYPSTETRNPSWVKELRNAGIQLSLLNETGGITMTKKDNRIQLQTTR